MALRASGRPDLDMLDGVRVVPPAGGQVPRRPSPRTEAVRVVRPDVGPAVARARPVRRSGLHSMPEALVFCAAVRGVSAGAGAARRPTHLSVFSSSRGRSALVGVRFAERASFR